MKILVCDDEIHFANYIAEKLEDIVPKASINICTDPSQVISQDEKFDVAFVDIEMGDFTGFDVVKHLQHQNPVCVTTFFTSHSEFATKGYEYNIFRYISKNEPESSINRQVKATIKEYARKHKILQINHKGNIANLRLSDVIYIEIFGRTATVHTQNGEYEWNERLKEILGKYSQFGFSQCHKSYLVNLSHVKSIGADVVLSNDKELPIGRAFKKDFEENYVNFKVNGDIL